MQAILINRKLEWWESSSASSSIHFKGDWFRFANYKFCNCCDEEENLWTNSGQKSEMRTLARLNSHQEGSRGRDRFSVCWWKKVKKYILHIIGLPVAFLRQRMKKLFREVVHFLSMASSGKGWFSQCNFFGWKLGKTEPIIWAFEAEARKAASGMFSDSSRLSGGAGEKGFSWRWHWVNWVNKPFCCPFCRTALVGGVQCPYTPVLGSYLQDLGCQIQSFGGCKIFDIFLYSGLEEDGQFIIYFLYSSKTIVLHFHRKCAMMQLSSRWISSNSFSAFNSHLLKLNERGKYRCLFSSKFWRKFLFLRQGMILRNQHFTEIPNRA